MNFPYVDGILPSKIRRKWDAGSELDFEGMARTWHIAVEMVYVCHSATIVHSLAYISMNAAIIVENKFIVEIVNKNYVA